MSSWSSQTILPYFSESYNHWTLFTIDLTPYTHFPDLSSWWRGVRLTTRCPETSQRPRPYSDPDRGCQMSEYRVETPSRLWRSKKTIEKQPENNNTTRIIRFDFTSVPQSTL